MTFTIKRNLVFIDSMQFMNSSSDLLFKNLPDNDFKCLSEKFSGDLVAKLVKKKGVYSSEDKLPDRCKFFSYLKDKCVSEKDYVEANNIWNVFKMNTMGDDYHHFH